MKDGTKVDPESLYEKGANRSLIHVDFMVGSGELSIIGRTSTGEEVEIFRNGNWVNKG